MGKVIARASTQVEAPPERILEVLRDYETSRPRILTTNYSDYAVADDGNLISFHFAAGGRERDYRLRVEHTAGALVERDERSSFVTRWTVEPSAAGSTVTIESSWDGAGGIAGFFEGRFAPLGLKRIYREVLAKLAAELAG